MEISLADWHYPHRTILENVEYFLTQGYHVVGMLSFHMTAVLNDGHGDALAEILTHHDGYITIHGKLPHTHAEEHVKDFQQEMDAYGAWQKKYNRVLHLTFDVRDNIRDNILPYVEYALTAVPNCKVGCEDFGLNERECTQLEPLRGNPRFGYLLDIGHMYIRLRGEDKTGYTLFTNSPMECPATKTPTKDDFVRAFRSKTFPVFEIHLHNNNGVDDQHLFLEDGTLDMHIVAETLKEVGFDGIITIESAPGFTFECRGEEADRRIAFTREYWKNIYEA